MEHQETLPFHGILMGSRDTIRLGQVLGVDCLSLSSSSSKCRTQVGNGDDDDKLSLSADDAHCNGNWPIAADRVSVRSVVFLSHRPKTIGQKHNVNERLPCLSLSLSIFLSFPWPSNDPRWIHYAYHHGSNPCYYFIILFGCHWNKWSIDLICTTRLNRYWWRFILDIYSHIQFNH